jgi:hypothetical protein
MSLVDMHHHRLAIHIGSDDITGALELGFGVMASFFMCVCQGLASHSLHRGESRFATLIDQ